uniref:Interleukin-1 n=1 Tax=Astyanax mexicanus TaxID=7994 RepID=A0A8B9H926_ASTMX
TKDTPTFPKCSDSIHVFRKEELTLNFKLEMVREECLEAEEENEIEPEWESDDMEDKELVMVSMTETNVAVVRGRGCDLENPCNNCGINGCNVSEVFMEAKNRDVTSGKSMHSTISNSTANALLSHCVSVSFRIICLSENVTIYYYQSDITEDGKISYPVVLNLTGTNKFLKCTRNNEEVILTTEDKLKDICKDNPATWPFVFFMKTEDVNNRLFESAENRGWFIRTVNEQGFLWVNKIDESKEPFYFLIYLDTENN